MNSLLTEKYLHLLNNWIPAADKFLNVPDDRPDLMYYGDGTNGWGVQTNQKALSAYAVTGALLNNKDYIDKAISMLRYSLESHKTGSYHVSDGDDLKWGHTWISVLGVERMMHGVYAIWDHLSDNDKDMIKDMLVSESDYLLEKHPVRGDPVSPNVPESNMWNGAVMYRTAMMYPDTPNADRYIEKGISFMMNAISIPSESGEDWFIGANFFDSFSLNHHGYLNVGYMVITLSNAAMLYFNLKELGFTPPEALYHNYDKLWQLVKTCLYDDGRLFRIGGDTRVRYCYCQDYLLPVLAFVNDVYGEDTSMFENAWISTVQKEVNHNGDGSFLSDRLELFLERSILYYTRLESDRAMSLSFNAYYRNLFSDYKNANNKYFKDIPRLSQWYDEYHGSCYVLGKNRRASFTWDSAELPQGNCLPVEDSSLFESKNNMTSLIYGDGSGDTNILGKHNEKMIDGGFASCGYYTQFTKGLLAEQISEEHTIRNAIAFAALPDDSTVVTLQLAKPVKNVHITELKIFNFMIPNDIYNDFKRDYNFIGKQLVIDGKINVKLIYGGDIIINNPPYRQVGLKNTQYRQRGMLHCDEICVDNGFVPHIYRKNETVFDFGAVVSIGSNIDITAESIDTNSEFIRAVKVIGQDGKAYIVYANLGENKNVFSCDGKSYEIEPYSSDIIII